jgi:hypothetical protein
MSEWRSALTAALQQATAYEQKGVRVEMSLKGIERRVKKLEGDGD